MISDEEHARALSTGMHECASDCPPVVYDVWDEVDVTSFGDSSRQIMKIPRLGNVPLTDPASREGECYECGETFPIKELRWIEFAEMLVNGKPEPDGGAWACTNCWEEQL